MEFALWSEPVYHVHQSTIRLISLLPGRNKDGKGSWPYSLQAAWKPFTGFEAIPAKGPKSTRRGSAKPLCAGSNPAVASNKVLGSIATKGPRICRWPLVAFFLIPAKGPETLSRLRVLSHRKKHESILGNTKQRRATDAGHGVYTMVMKSNPKRTINLFLNSGKNILDIS